MRVFLVFLMAAIAIPANAGADGRAAAAQALVDAAAHAALCTETIWQINRSVVMDLMLGSDMVQSEQDALPARLRTASEALKKTAVDVICRDAVERYGPAGSVVKDLLIRG